MEFIFAPLTFVVLPLADDEGGVARVRVCVCEGGAAARPDMARDESKHLDDWDQLSRNSREVCVLTD